MAVANQGCFVPPLPDRYRSNTNALTADVPRKVRECERCTYKALDNDNTPLLPFVIHLFFPFVIYS